MYVQCRYHRGMKRDRFGMFRVLAGSILLCICIIDAAAQIESGTAEKKDSSIVVETVTSSETRTVRLYPFDQIPNSTEARESITMTWLSAPIEKVIGRAAESYTDSKGNTFTISGAYPDGNKNYYMISVIPTSTDYSLPDRNLVPQGTWILYRKIDTGAPALIKIYPRENPALSISLHPAAQKAHRGKSFIDVCLFNAYICKDVAIGVPFETLYQMSLSRLKDLAKDVIPWALFSPPRYNSPVRTMSRIVGNRSDRLVYLEDGCFDHDGKPVHISSLQPQTETEIQTAMNIMQTRAEVLGGVNSAGFVKWVIDGMIRPVAGQGTVIGSLKRLTEVPQNHFTQPVLDTKNVFFGLDWIRNLGAAALSLNLNRTVYPDDSGLDVTDCPFALNGMPASELGEMPAADRQPAFLGYQKYAGYQVSYLQPLLYYFASMETDHFYLACMSSEALGSELRTYTQMAVFFPYFDEWGDFHLDIYENGEQIPVNDFIKKYKDSYAALVRIRAPEVGLFNP